MSRGTMAPPAGTPAAPPNRAGQPGGAQLQPAGAANRPGIVPARVTRKAFEGTPGRMRLVGVLAALAAAVFGVIGASALWSSAGALDRADHNTAQVVRIQSIYANLVRADADATNAFLVGGLEDTAQRADYDASLTSVASDIAAAAQAQPADANALGALNGLVQTYAANVEQARVYNRQGQPVGAQYLSNASASLRSQMLPIVNNLVTANKGRADAEFAASSRLIVLALVGVAAVLVLAFALVWLARRTHRYLNLPISSGTVLVAVALVVGLVTIGGVANQVTAVRTGDFARTVALANARSAAYDAKANESLTLIARGSGGAYQTAWDKQSDAVKTELALFDTPKGNPLKDLWKNYTDAHDKIRGLDNNGDWDGAVAAATATKVGSARAQFDAFDASVSKNLSTYRTSTSAALVGPVVWVTILGWFLLVLCVAAALLVVRGIGQRVEEYR